MLLMGLIPQSSRFFLMNAGDDLITILSNIIAVNLGQRLLFLITTLRTSFFEISGSKLKFKPVGLISPVLIPFSVKIACVSLANPQIDMVSGRLLVISVSKI